MFVPSNVKLTKDSGPSAQPIFRLPSTFPPTRLMLTEPPLFIATLNGPSSLPRMSVLLKLNVIWVLPATVLSPLAVAVMP